MMMKMHLVIGSPARWSYSGCRARVCDSSMSTSCSLDCSQSRHDYQSVRHSHSPVHPRLPRPDQRRKRKRRAQAEVPSFSHSLVRLGLHVCGAALATGSETCRRCGRRWSAQGRFVPWLACMRGPPAAIRDSSCCGKAQDPRSGQEAREEPTTPLGSIARAAFLLPLAPIGKHARRTGGSESGKVDGEQASPGVWWSLRKVLYVCVTGWGGKTSFETK
jgi:hypothetical protein